MKIFVGVCGRIFAVVAGALIYQTATNDPHGVYFAGVWLSAVLSAISLVVEHG